MVCVLRLPFALELIRPNSLVQLARAPEGPEAISTIAICAGSGGSVLDGVAADVYFTGEMGHVRAFRSTC